MLAMVRPCLSLSLLGCDSLLTLCGGRGAQTVTTFLSSMAYLPVSLYLPIYTSSLSSSSSTANLVVALFNLSSMVGSTLTGYASDVSLPVTLSVMGAAGAVLSLTAWGLAQSLGAVFAFAVLFAAFSQVCSCVAPASLLLPFPPGSEGAGLTRRAARAHRAWGGGGARRSGRQPSLVDHDLLPLWHLPRRRASRPVPLLSSPSLVSPSRIARLALALPGRGAQLTQLSLDSNRTRPGIARRHPSWGRSSARDCTTRRSRPTSSASSLLPPFLSRLFPRLARAPSLPFPPFPLAVPSYLH